MNTIRNFVPLAAMLFIVITIQSCFGLTGERVSGNGNVTKQDRKIASFNVLDISGTFNVYISQGETEALSIEADENLIPLVETRVEDKTLYIEVKKDYNIGHANKKNIYVTIKDINKLKVSSVGNIESAGSLNLQHLELSSSAVGNLYLNLSCNQLEVDIHSIGNSTLKGKAGNVEIKNSSIGNMDASGLIAEVLKINNSSVGNVEVYAEKELYIHSSGVGNLTFSGNAVVKELSSSGVGKVSKK